MAKKIYYRHNPATGRYEKVYPGTKERVVATLMRYAGGIVVGLLVVIGAYCFIDFPREKELRQQKERLQVEMDLLETRADRAIEVVEQLALRDNNFYRVMLQADPADSSWQDRLHDRNHAYDSILSMSDASLLSSVDRKLTRLENAIVARSESYDYLYSQIGALRNRINNIPAIMPLSEKNLRAMASGYGYRIDPIYGTSKFHEGMDFSAPTGTPVYVTGNGIVTDAKYDGAYGNVVTVNHGFNYITRYAHLSQITVKPGQRVSRGDMVGKVGATGKSTGSHLHYEVRLRNQPQNPVNYYFFDITPEEYEEMIARADNSGHTMD